MLGRQLSLDLLVLDEPALGRVDQEHAPRLEAALAHHPLWCQVEDPDLAGEDDEAVVGDPVAGRAQPVAVEDGADHRAVGEADRCRTVPWLHERSVVAVEGAPSRSMVVWFSHASGIIMSTACGRERPPRCSSSSTSSKLAESLAPGVHIG